MYNSYYGLTFNPFDTPPLRAKGQFISAKVEIRYLPDDMTSAYILFDGEKFPIRQTSRNDNCHTRRNNPPAIDYSKAGGEA